MTITGDWNIETGRYDSPYVIYDTCVGCGSRPHNKSWKTWEFLEKRR